MAKKTSNNRTLSEAKSAKQDEFYTQLEFVRNFDAFRCANSQFVESSERSKGAEPLASSGVLMPK